MLMGRYPGAGKARYTVKDLRIFGDGRHGVFCESMDNAENSPQSSENPRSFVNPRLIVKSTFKTRR